MATTTNPSNRKAGDTARRRRRSFDDLRPRQEEVVLHGHRVSYRVAGDHGPVVLLIHGIVGCAEQWDQVAVLLADRHQVVAPDLLGHGQSAKPRGDYSLGAYAASVRDLLVALGHRRATVVGHSLGGGVAMQFVYESPPFAERLVLASSGGLGREVHPMLRAATLPGSELVLPLIAHQRLHGVGSAIGQALSRLGLRAGPDLAEMARGYASLADANARQAFIHSLRAVLDLGGQRVSATDRLYLAELLPSLIIWGSRDPLIPPAHARSAHRGLPGSRLEVFENVGHFPQLQDPVRFAHTLIDFIDTTKPTRLDFTAADLKRWQDLLRRGTADRVADSAQPPARKAAAG
ncbi:MAG: alpha/beta hydrolase [Solirubrobacterales bacterium]|nr:alpha/beta hydrolase [Solirubrobacterales bacterium]MBV9473076.1 alpha/beta hydrolase [Solirubrobacterales bacterium]